MKLTFERNKRSTGTNSTYPKVAFQWLNQALCYYPSLCLVDSEVLRNRHLRVAAKRSLQAEKKPTAQTAHLVFAYTQATAEKTKRAVSCQRYKI